MKIRTCVFPVAGLGTRFLPATKSIPKEMMVVVDKPLIQYAVEEARAAGIERFVFITSLGKTAIEDHFDASPILEQTLFARGREKDLKCIQDVCLPAGQAIFVRQHRPLGLGHAVLCARALIDDEAFAVILADDLVQAPTSCLAQMIEAYQETDGNMAGVMQVARHDTQKYGILGGLTRTGDKVLASHVVEKPTPDAAPSQTGIIGRYILRKEIFKHLEKQETGAGSEIQLTDALSHMLPTTPLTGYVFQGKRFDCGTKYGWLQANIAFALEDPDLAGHLEGVL